jgi:polysaccharide export outer membrane protein
MRRLVASLLCLLMATAALAQPAPAEPPLPATVQATSEATPGKDDGLERAYRLGAGDKVRIVVYGESDLSGEFDVPSAQGKIAFPLIGDVQAGGLNVGELQTEIEGRLRGGYLKDPRVSIEVLTYRPFYILGEVTKPGEYPYTSGLTVLNAVAIANGFTYRADKRRVFIKRNNDPEEHEYRMSTETKVAPGDTIRIMERYF